MDERMGRPTELSSCLHATKNGFNRVKKEVWFFIEEDDARPTRRNTTIENGNETKKCVLKEESARLEIRRKSYNVRAAKTWNQIPDEVRQKKTVNGFKTAYDKWKS